MRKGEPYWAIGCKEGKMALKGTKVFCKFKPDQPFDPEVCMRCKYKRVGVWKIVEEEAIEYIA